MGDSHKTQLRKTYLTFKKPKTRLEAAYDTGIMRASICRFVATLRESSKIAVIKKGHCPITGYPAETLTTDEDLFPEDNQTDMFGGEA